MPKQQKEFVPAVSVIVPNFNHARYLRERVDSILAQTFEDVELILLDDASTDGSQDILRSYESHPRVAQVVVNEVNSGNPFTQWRRGVELARGTYVWIAESDDACTPEFLERVVARGGDGVGLVYAQSTDVDAGGAVLAHRAEWTDDIDPDLWRNDFEMDGCKFARRFLSVKNVIPNASAVLFEKRLFEQADKLPERLRMCGDWYLWAEMACRTRVAFVAEALNRFRADPQSTRASGYDRHLRRIPEKVLVLDHVAKLTGADVDGLVRSLMTEWWRIMYYQGRLREACSRRVLRKTFDARAGFAGRVACGTFVGLGWAALCRRGRALRGSPV